MIVLSPPKDSPSACDKVPDEAPESVTAPEVERLAPVLNIMPRADVLEPVSSKVPEPLLTSARVAAAQTPFCKFEFPEIVKFPEVATIPAPVSA